MLILECLCPFQPIRVLGPLLSKEGYDCHFTKISCHVTSGEALRSKVAERCWHLVCRNRGLLSGRNSWFPPHSPPWDGRGCLAAGWMLDADKIGPNSSLLLTAMEPSQGTSPLYPGHLSQAVTMKNTHTGGLLGPGCQKAWCVPNVWHMQRIRCLPLGPAKTTMATTEAEPRLLAHLQRDPTWRHKAPGR